MKTVVRQGIAVWMIVFSCSFAVEVCGEIRTVVPSDLAKDGEYGKSQFGRWVAVKGNHLLVGQGTPDGKGEAAFLFAVDSGDDEGAFNAKYAGFASSGAITETRSFVGAKMAKRDGLVLIIGFEDEFYELKSPEKLAGFGAAIAVEGDSMLIGADTVDDVGAAYLYIIASRELKQTFKTEGLTQGAQFGATVALSPKYAVVGAPGHKDGGGAAFVFDRATGKMVHRLEPAADENSTQFGKAIAISGDRLLVAAPGGKRGKCYLFDAASGKELASLDENGSFGFAVTISGDLGIIADGSGFVLVVDLKTLKVVNRIEHESKTGFGRSIAVDGENLCVGAPFANDNAGKVFILTDWKTAHGPGLQVAGPAQPKAKPERSWETDHRIWIDKTGKHKIDAMYDSYVGKGVIRLRKKDGSTIDVPMSKLSNADRLFAVDASKEDRKALRTITDRNSNN